MKRARWSFGFIAVLALGWPTFYLLSYDPETRSRETAARAKLKSRGYPMQLPSDKGEVLAIQTMAKRWERLGN